MWLTGWGLRPSPVFGVEPREQMLRLDGLGWVEGFEPSATGTTIRRSTKLSYTHRVKGTPV